MKPLSALRAHLVAGEFEFTQHAVKRMVERNISDAEIREAGGKAFIVEDYPDDKYGPSCLLLGFTAVGRPLHIQVTCGSLGPRVKIITLYEPHSAKWLDFAERSHRYEPM
uniref:DUF4258 domain-containing protein n=1 Tax=Candidatus Kentrum sp. TC TaxID=2126339 RepID=A0A450ZRU7_9GAMM|nr:MAG: protein of unknown function (DUF4258) [Candidatus Kentron sp. TC]